MEREDYFFGEQISVNRSKVYALVIYDIVDNSKRTKLHKLLNGYGTSIQKSGFEICVSPHKFEKLLNQIPAFCGRYGKVLPRVCCA